MKAIKTLMMAGALAVAAPAFAQFSNASAGGNSSTGGSTIVKDTNPYDRISLSYSSNKISIDEKGADDANYNGVAIDYIHGFSVSKTLPIFIETGIGADFGFYRDTEDNEYGEYKTIGNAISLSIPINVAYKFNVNPDFSIQPYLGLNLKLNIFSETTFKSSYYLYDSDGDVCDTKDETYTLNNFDKKDVDIVWNRFQLGWHIGVGLNYKAFYFGLSYGTDFMELAKKANTSTFKVGVGFTF